MYVQARKYVHVAEEKGRDIIIIIIIIICLMTLE